jgi:hypothetical protein
MPFSSPVERRIYYYWLIGYAREGIDRFDRSGYVEGVQIR